MLGRMRQSQSLSGHPQQIDWKFVLFLCLASLLFIAAWSVPVFQNAFRRDLIYDSDSVLRLVQVRDLLAGQSWFDMRQQRLGFGDGTLWHWSRLSDIGPALLILLFEPVVGQAQAERLMMIVYPALLFIPLVLALYWACGRVSVQIVRLEGVPPQSRQRGWALAGMLGVMLIQMDSVLYQFLPGLIDHHSLQMIFLVVLVGATIGPRTVLSGLIAAGGLTLGLVVGIDSIPFIVGALGGVVLAWALDPKAEQKFLTALGLGTMCLTLFTMASLMPRPFTLAWCDSWTLPLAGSLFVVSLYLLLLAGPVSRVKRLPIRIGIAGAFGVAVLLGLLTFFPACRDPLQLHDPLFQTYWMGKAEENLSPWVVISWNPLAIVPQLFAASALGLGAYLVATKRLSLSTILPLLAVLVCGFLGNALYQRVGPMLSLCVIILFAPAIIAVITTMGPGLKRLGMWALCVPTAFVQAYVMVWFGLSDAVSPVSTQKTGTAVVDGAEDFSNRPSLPTVVCFGADQLAALRALPPSRIIAPFGQSEYLLHTTQHTLVYSGYHRLNKDLGWVMRWLLAPPDQAKAQLDERPFDYVSVCPRDIQFRNFARDYPDSLIANLIKGRAPDWLVPAIKLQSGGVIYRVKRHEALQESTPAP
jgi:hypothetical protein